MKILLFGASGDTGRHILKQAVAKGHEVIGAEPHPPAGFADEYASARIEKVDLLNDDMSSLFEGCDAVVSAIGLGRDPKTLLDPPPLYTEGAVRMVKAMRRSGPKRLVVISAAFVDPDVDIPGWFRGATLPLANIFRQMGDMERILRVADDIDWTAVRAGWLLDRPFTDDYEVVPDNLPEGCLRTRHADLADFMLKCIEEGEWVRQTPCIARREDDKLETPPALIEELRPS